MKHSSKQLQPEMPKVVQDCHKFLAWVIPQLDKFPRNRRFTLGERLESEMLEVLAASVSAAYSQRKQPLLERASQRISVAQHLWRLAYSNTACPPKQSGNTPPAPAVLRPSGGAIPSPRDRQTTMAEKRV